MKSEKSENKHLKIISSSSSTKKEITLARQEHEAIIKAIVKKKNPALAKYIQ
jgi:hypothetical protein